MTLGSLLMVVLVLALVGFLVWLITTRIPMDATFRTIIYVVVVVCLVLWLLNASGLMGAMNTPLFGHR